MTYEPSLPGECVESLLVSSHILLLFHLCKLRPIIGEKQFQFANPIIQSNKAINFRGKQNTLAVLNQTQEAVTMFLKRGTIFSKFAFVRIQPFCAQFSGQRRDKQGLNILQKS